MPLLKRMLLRTLMLILALALAGSAGAQDEAAGEAPEDEPFAGPPVVVANVASVERVLEDIDYLFGSVDR